MDHPKVSVPVGPMWLGSIREVTQQATALDR
jgi:hypothetical protein